MVRGAGQFREIAGKEGRGRRLVESKSQYRFLMEKTGFGAGREESSGTTKRNLITNDFFPPQPLQLLLNLSIILYPSPNQSILFFFLGYHL